MGSVKLWDGSAWQAVLTAPGPQGPAGAQATDSAPRGPAGGGLIGHYPSPGVNRPVAGTLLAVQRDWSQGTTWVGITTGANFTRVGSTPLAISYTPPVACWWMVDAYVGGLQKVDAAYHYCYLHLNISPADADGHGTRSVVKYQNSNVQAFEWRAIRHVFNLAADTTYTCTMQAAFNGGTWQFHQNDQSTWLTGRAWAQ